MAATAAFIVASSSRACSSNDGLNWCTKYPMPMEPCTIDIQTSALTSSGVGLPLGSEMPVHSIQFHTGFLPCDHWTRLLTPLATYSGCPATGGSVSFIG